MDEKTKAEYKDKFLRYIMAQERGCSADNLFKDILKPGYPQGYSKKLIDEIDSYNDNLLEVYRGDVSYLLDKTDFTKEFLDKGGFVAEYNRQLEAAQKLNESAKREANIKELQEVELKQKIKYNKYALRISIISALVAVASFLYTILQPKPESNDDRLKAIENRLDSLETPTAKKVDSVIIKNDTIK